MSAMGNAARPRGTEFDEVASRLRPAAGVSHQAAVIITRRPAPALGAALVNTRSPHKVLLAERAVAVLCPVSQRIKLEVDSCPRLASRPDLSRSRRGWWHKAHKIRRMRVITEPRPSASPHPQEVCTIATASIIPVLMSYILARSLDTSTCMGIEVSVAGSRRADLPPGLGFNARGGKGARGESDPAMRFILGLAGSHRDQQRGTWPYTPATNLCSDARSGKDARGRGMENASPGTSATAPRRARRSRCGAWKRNARSRARTRPR